MSLQLSLATPDDFEYARGIHHSAYREMVLKQFGEWDESVQDAFFTRTWTYQVFYILHFGDEPCGFCSIERNDDGLRLKEFAIDVAKQGKGIGSLFLEYLKAKGAEQDCPVLINVMETNGSARALYEKHGFCVCGENDFQFLLRYPQEPAQAT